MSLFSAYPSIPQDYLELPPQDKQRICNGCGPKFAKIDLIPNSLWGLDITELCNIHDYMYHQGTTLQDKVQADLGFRDNMFFHIDLYTTNWIMRKLRRGQAAKYYWAVYWFGFPSFIGFPE